MNIDLPVYRLRFDFKALERVLFPAYAGSAWRGLFGTTLRRSVCVTQASDCQGCLLRQQCAYSLIFESPPPPVPSTILSQAPAVPHPYVICPLATSGGTFAAGEPFSIELRLIGRSAQYLPYIVHTVQQMGARGIGMRAGAGRFALEQVWQLLPQDQAHRLYTPGGELAALQTYQPAPCPTTTPDGVRIEFHTPYRSQQQGQLLRPWQFNPRQFITTLSRRISMLQAFHATGEPQADYKQLAEAASTLEMRYAQLYWHDWTRFSSRQQHLIKMGGIQGTVELYGTALAGLLALLRKGEEVHVGKAAVMGLGGYQLSLLT